MTQPYIDRATDPLVRNSKGWPIYCVAYAFTFRNVFNGKRKTKWEFEYVHAENQTHARGQFLVANHQKTLAGRLEILEVGAVLGAHATDDNGDQATL